ncbi:stress responsive protein [Bacteroidia bacterium]|nr:stress responsive protein [Bacteroidia bacterium]
MKKVFFLTCMAFAILLGFSSCNDESVQVRQKMLRHVILFDFQDDLSAEQIKEIETAFVDMVTHIEEIKAFEWGTEIDTTKSTTHCFIVSFTSKKDFDAYSVHPVHLQFGKMVHDKIKTVALVDYWEK